MAQVNSNQQQERGCWTCRARRKRCDGRTPSCDTCRRLGIACSGFSSTRPCWMDGGREQQEYCNGLKKVIKRNRTRSSPSSHSTPSSSSEYFKELAIDAGTASTANYRHSNTMEFPDFFGGLQTPPLLVDTSSSFSSGIAAKESFSTPDATFQNEELIQTWSCPQSWMYQNTDTPSISEYHEQLFENPKAYFPEFEASIAPMHTTPPSLPAVEMDIVNESLNNNLLTKTNPMNWSLIATYMDHTFYDIFPYFCYASGEAGRGWLLNMISNSVSVRSSVMSIEIFTRCRDSGLAKAEMDDEAEGNAEFQAEYRHSIEEHNKEIDTLLQSNDKLSKEIREEFLGRVLICLVHYVYLEKVLGAPIKSRESHLSHANQVLKNWSQQCTTASDTSRGVLDPRSTILRRSLTVTEGRPSSHQEVSLFAAKLIQWMVISQASADPRDSEIQSGFSWESNPEISCLSRNDACPIRLMLTIESITSLAKWKDQCSSAGTLSIFHLARRADAVEQDILAELTVQETSVPRHASMNSCHFRSWNAKEGCITHKKLLNITTALFAHAARIYLHVVLSGANPKVSEIKKSVKKALRLFRNLDTMDLDTVVWPLAVTGSMMRCDNDGEIAGRQWMTEALDELACKSKNTRWKKISNFLRQCWNTSSEKDGMTCDWAAGMKALGLPVELLM